MFHQDEDLYKWNWNIECTNL